MDDQLHRHFEDIFQLLDDICSAVLDVNQGTPAGLLRVSRIQAIKEHIAEASKFLTDAR